MECGATFSDCGRFRFRLWRRWSPGPVLILVMLNPSRAGAYRPDGTPDNDPTVTRGIGFAQRLGYGGLEVVNLSDYIATKPADLFAAGVPVSPLCDSMLAAAAARTWLEGSLLVAGWGRHSDRMPARRDHVVGLLRGAGANIHALRTTADGVPWHPLYLPSDCQPFPL